MADYWSDSFFFFFLMTTQTAALQGCDASNSDHRTLPDPATKLPQNCLKGLSGWISGIYSVETGSRGGNCSTDSFIIIIIRTLNLFTWPVHHHTWQPPVSWLRCKKSNLDSAENKGNDPAARRPLKVQSDERDLRKHLTTFPSVWIYVSTGAFFILLCLQS